MQGKVFDSERMKKVINVPIGKDLGHFVANYSNVYIWNQLNMVYER